MMPASVKINIGLIALIALLWFSFSILAFNNQYVKISNDEIRVAIGILSLGCSLCLALTAWLLSKRNRIIYHATTILLGLILIASFMDDLGLVDFLMITITAVTLGLLIKNRTWFLQK